MGFTDEKASVSVEAHEIQGIENPGSRASGSHEVGRRPLIHLTPTQERRLYRKIDLRLIPMLTLMYTCSFLDRWNAKLQGLVTELDLTGNKYNIALAMYFIPFCIIECPASLLTKKFRPSRWLPTITVTFGVIMTLMGLVRTYPQLVGTRVALGAAETGLFPGAVWYFSMWYPRHKLQWRIGILWAGATLAGAFSGLLAYAISFMSGIGGKLGWSWIFIIEGLLTVVVGILAYFVIVDFPDDAKFLTPEEREYVIWRKKYDNSSFGEEERFSFKYVFAAVLDWQPWIFVIIYISALGPLYGISYFLPTIINNFGFDPVISQLLTIPPYVVGTCLIVLFAFLSDRVKMRSPSILACHAMTLLGFGIQISNAHFSVKYFGTFFCVAGPYAAHPGITSWLLNNLAGQYKRGAALTIPVGFGTIIGAVSSVIYRPQDAPRYILGDAVSLMFCGLGVITICAVAWTYTNINAKRAAFRKELEDKGMSYSVRELREMGDRAPDFQYTL